MNKLKFILAVSIAAALTLSCQQSGNEDPESSSSGKESGNGGSSSPSKGSSSSKGSSGVASNSSGPGTPVTQTFDIKNQTSSQFTIAFVEKYYECKTGGVLSLEEYSGEGIMRYSISNRIMTWQIESSSNDTLNFKGSSNDLIGTWTRTKDRSASCRIETDSWCREYGGPSSCNNPVEYCSYYDPEYDECLEWDYYCDDDYDVCLKWEEDSWYDCKDGYDITKAVFTNKNVEITREICFTDDEIDEGEEEGNGWKWKIIDCNTAELSRGTEKINYKITDPLKEEFTISYKGKSCKRSEPSESQRRTACTKAWNEHKEEYYWDDYYYDLLDAEFDSCMKNLLPADLAKPAAKIKAKAKAAKIAKAAKVAKADKSAKFKAKAKFTPLLKKKR